MPIAALCGSLEQDALRALGSRSAAELGVIADFLRDTHDIGVEHVARVEKPDS